MYYDSDLQKIVVGFTRELTVLKNALKCYCNKKEGRMKRIENKNSVHTIKDLDNINELKQHIDDIKATLESIEVALEDMRG